MSFFYPWFMNFFLFFFHRWVIQLNPTVIGIDAWAPLYDIHSYIIRKNIPYLLFISVLLYWSLSIYPRPAQQKIVLFMNDDDKFSIINIDVFKYYMIRGHMFWILEIGIIFMYFTWMKCDICARVQLTQKFAHQAQSERVTTSCLLYKMRMKRFCVFLCAELFIKKKLSN